MDEVLDHTAGQRFELRRDGELISYAVYELADDGQVVVVPHVETVLAHRGHGSAAQLMEGVLAQLRADGRTIVPLCSFAAGHIRDNPQHHDLVAGPSTSR